MSKEMGKWEMEFNINDKLAELTEKIDDQIISCWKLDRKEVEQALVTVRVLNDLKEWLKHYLTLIDKPDAHEEYIIDTLNEVLFKISELEELYKCSQ